jgi:hypothetical protein
MKSQERDILVIIGNNLTMNLNQKFQRILFKNEQS